MTWTSDAKEAARKYARETIVNEEKERYFIAGVDWTLDTLFRKLSHAPYEYSTGYPKAFIEKLMLSDVRNILEEWCKGRERVNTEEDK